jgi:phosphoribosylaminoimidazolecarboxamide formyltransferase/IMP cyclohydrolase
MDLKQKYKTVMDDNFPEKIEIKIGDSTLIYRKRTWKIYDEKQDVLIEKGLRYGENPGQQAALYELVNGNLTIAECKYIDPGKGLVSSLTEENFLQFGKHPGKINLTDIDAGLNILKFLYKKPAAVIVKHNNPCGVSFGESIAEAYNKANMADRIAAFGGCAVFNRAIDRETAELVSENYLEVVVAPEYEDGTVEILKQRKNLRIVKMEKIDNLEKYRYYRFIDFKSLIDGGFILQQSQLNKIETKDDFLPATCVYKGKEYKIERQPTEDEYNDMLFGWWVEQGVTSNSVLYVKNGTTVGIGTGEQDRVGVAEIAVFKAYTKYSDRICWEKYKIPYKNLELEIKKGLKPEKLKTEIDEQVKEEKGGLIGSTMVSDAFFPFRDGVDVGITQGIRAIVQPGGSERDFEAIEACNEANPQVTMVFTGERSFKH